MGDAVRIEVDHLTDAGADPLILTDTGWLSYDIVSDMQNPADTFTLRLDPNKELVEWFRRPGHTLRVYCDGNLQMTGLVESAPIEASAEGLSLRVLGRDFGCLLIEDTAPMLEYANQSLRALVQKLVAKHGAYITEVVTDNVANRYKICGKPVGAAAKKGLSKDAAEKKEYLKALAAASANKGTSSQFYRGVETTRLNKWRTDPGQKIWEVIKWMASQIGYLVWMGAKGELIISQPDYWQESPYEQLYVTVDDRMQVTGSNCTMSHEADIGDRYSTYAVTGQGTPSASSLGVDLSQKYAAAKDPARAFYKRRGSSLTERVSKTDLISVSNVEADLLVRRIARKRLEENLVQSAEITASMSGHRQTPDTPLWACDTVVDVEFGPREIKAPYYIWRRTFRYDASGRTTELGLIPAGFWYGYDHNTYDDASYLADLASRYDRYAL